jgi:hypothetical protein
MYSDALCIDGVVSTAFQQLHAVPRDAISPRTGRGVRKQAKASDPKLEDRMENLSNHADYLVSLSEAEFRAQNGLFCPARRSNLALTRILMVRCSAVCWAFEALTTASLVHDIVFDLSALENEQPLQDTHNTDRYSDVSLRLCFEMTSPDNSVRKYQLICHGDVSDKNTTASPSTGHCSSHASGLDTAFSRGDPVALDISRAERVGPESISLRLLQLREDETHFRAAGQAEFGELEMSMLENPEPLMLAERMALACSIARHALVLLGSPWGSFFSATEIRRRRGPSLGAHWKLHAHNHATGPTNHLQGDAERLSRTQIVDIGILLCSIALNRCLTMTDEDPVVFVSRVLPAVGREMGQRYRKACEACIGVEDVMCLGLSDHDAAEVGWECPSVDGLLGFFCMEVYHP